MSTSCSTVETLGSSTSLRRVDHFTGRFSNRPVSFQRTLMSHAPIILVVGELDRSEFASVRDWLGADGRSANVQKATSLAVLEGDVVSPDLIVVCQSWPDEFTSHDVTQCLGRWPLALWVCCYGAWCASDGRTRTTWPISVRTPVDEACGRLTHLWQILHDGHGDPLPLTASRDEAFEFDHCVSEIVTPPETRP